MINEPVDSKKNIISRVLDIFYPLFERLISFEVYRYLAVGGICFLINFCIFHLTYYFLMDKGDMDMGFFNNNLKSLMASMSITLPVGFFLNKNYVFKKSLPKGNQLLKYGTSTIASVYFSKKLLDFLVLNLNWNITVSFLLTTAIIQTLNYFFQKKVSFQN